MTTIDASLLRARYTCLAVDTMNLPQTRLPGASARKDTVCESLCYLSVMLAPFLTSALIAFQHQSGGRAIVKPEDTQIALVGRIGLVHGYGPPGWGEDPKHDARIVYWVIDLPEAINTPCEPERPEWAASDCQSTKRLRLVIEAHQELVSEAKAVNGGRATVTGVLHRQDTAGEMTPIFMDVVDIKPLPK